MNATPIDDRTRILATLNDRSPIDAAMGWHPDSVKLTNLTRNGFHNVGDLRRATDTELLCVPTIGGSTLLRIRDAVRRVPARRIEPLPPTPADSSLAAVQNLLRLLADRPEISARNADAFCGACIYFDNENGRCRRHAPQTFLWSLELDGHGGQQGDWPVVEPDQDWCGEWRARK